MAKPVLSSVNVFDATEGVIAFFKIYVSYTSPNIIKEYEYSIYDGSDDKVICTSSGAYSNLSYTQNNGWGFHISPTEQLVNREENYYLRIRIKLTDESEYGEYSSPIVLYCKSKPSIAFSSLNKETENIIQMSATVFEMLYSYIKDQGETLKTYKYEFYDEDKKLVDETKTYYGTISHSFSVYGLEANKLYYVRGMATTKNGYELDTGYYPIRIGSVLSNGDYAFEAENDHYNAAIRLTSHFVSATGSPNGDVSYVKTADDKYAVDLTNGTKVTYFLRDQNKNLNDFDMKFIVKPDCPKEIVELNWNNAEYSVTGTLSILKRFFTDMNDETEKLFAALKINVDHDTYLIIKSNYIFAEKATGYLFVDVVCKDGYFEIYIESMDGDYQNAVLGQALLDRCIIGDSSVDNEN